jgi:hypothetical protein
LKTFLALMLIGLLSSTAFAADTVLEVIPLTNRPASEIVPSLALLLGDSAQLVDNGFNLLVKARPEQLAEIRAIVKKLDVRQSNLLITVVQSKQTSVDELNAAAGGQLDAPGGRIIGHLYQTQGKSADENTQSIRTLEGVTAHIKTGSSYPRQNFSAFGYPSTTEFTEASTGFAVTPRLTGRQVILSVAPWSDKMNGRGQLESQDALSTIRINLGEWVELGGSGGNSNRSSESAFANTYQIDKDRIHILVKVERVD